MGPCRLPHRVRLGLPTYAIFRLDAQLSLGKHRVQSLHHCPYTAL